MCVFGSDNISTMVDRRFLLFITNICNAYCLLFTVWRPPRWRFALYQRPSSEETVNSLSGFCVCPHSSPLFFLEDM